ncbi:MAG: GDP-mannose 4,6-dehydratase, partial [Gammaproteobacteria bacterium]
TQTRDFTHVSDVARANLAAMKSTIADGRALNVGRGSALSVNDIAELVGGPKVHGDRRPGDARATLADLTETRQVLGWEPQVNTSEAVRELVRTSGIAIDR